ncbi:MULTISPECIES: hypothetical protein [Bacillaceae]|uniref:hypothetical protein n=1 Tax=Bacillaceae TaxID=186817 RepID=UPI001E2D92AA|nr:MULTISPECIES: hypothetical protein [Bacillaceae]MCE4047795.1 hypothetical protein [Bacillus sp. Au-Bac7]MCM3031240.1 hypothetical protein [Niallia sp. MER 6]MDL0434818.1 hypothetical protein [Niallia sp. SS-2023]UPO89360.1 hypothetical protein L8T27_009515 [Niallia sp. Man26]
MTLKETVGQVLTTEDAVNKALETYDSEGYITVTDKEAQEQILAKLEDNGFYVYDEQFIDGVYRIYIEL